MHKPSAVGMHPSAAGNRGCVRAQLVYDSCRCMAVRSSKSQCKVQCRLTSFVHGKSHQQQHSSEWLSDSTEAISPAEPHICTADVSKASAPKWISEAQRQYAKPTVPGQNFADSAPQANLALSRQPNQLCDYRAKSLGWVPFRRKSGMRVCIRLAHSLQSQQRKADSSVYRPGQGHGWRRMTYRTICPQQIRLSIAACRVRCSLRYTKAVLNTSRARDAPQAARDGPWAEPYRRLLDAN